MQGKTHKVVAISSTISLAVIYFGAGTVMGIPVYPYLLPLTAAAGAFKADIDLDGVAQSKNTPLIMKIVKKFPVTKKLFRHRGFTHTTIPAAFVYFLALSLSIADGWAPKLMSSLVIGWLIGFLSHIFIDMFNGKGIPLLWPLYPKKIHIMSITTRTVEETLFFAFWMLLIVAHTVLVYFGMTL